jgi:phage/plasmid-like protein (TIGR03299 family)
MTNHNSILVVNNKLACEGVIADEVISPRDAMIRSGLDWSVAKKPLYFFDDQGVPSLAPDKFALVRSDTQTSLAVVGKGYTPFQNADLFKFIETFCEVTKTNVDSCGYIRDGALLWAATSSVEREFLPGDPSREYFLISNGHDGKSLIQIGFIYKRLVCHNMLLGLKDHANNFRIKHSSKVSRYVEAIQEVMVAQSFEAERFAELMKALQGKRLDRKTMEAITLKLTAPPNGVNAALLSSPRPTNSTSSSAESESESTPTASPDEARRSYSKILELVETGRGVNIPGVLGSAYGYVQAVVEYVDHYRQVRPRNRSENEARFESALFGQGAKLKTQAIELALAA